LRLIINFKAVNISKWKIRWDPH